MSGAPTHDIAEAADANFVVHASWVARHTAGMLVVEDAGLVLIDSGLPCDTFNFVCRARLEARNAMSRAATAIAHFSSAGRPFSWWVGPADTPNDLGDVLVGAGLARSESELAMAADLRALPELPDADDLVIRRVRTVHELTTFASISAANWTPPDHNVGRFYEMAAPLLLRDDAPLWLYLGYAGGDFQRAVLQAAPDGVRIYERLGFAPFGPITEYKP
jgi:hypothetical protein